ncbi:MAG TPA: single-stranded DNA-binding protein [Saprospiraceae bacterium]|nr:single-stranded DNA-binding protein [Saprospiraceae bacterium]MCB9269756.1 single-stranded DNA-binding protein [Lewinellaceae bacterium]HPG06638.1 single-stranded DNA-binding protein [Saprospiraceae bacterium]HPQ99097.1 single-stranded DNA-binding protein [Saprospiraceae bacterium]HQU52002.1 single-stranded DNA-binding protein [Saprospiraceae bacterium]
MNSLRNQVQLIGHLGRDPEMVALNNGTKLMKCTIATKDFYRDAQGNSKDNTQWHNLVAWGRTAELMTQLLRKGTEVTIQGQLQHREYEKDGVKKTFTEIKVDQFIKNSKDKTPF